MKNYQCVCVSVLRLSVFWKKSPLCFPNEDIVLHNTAINTQPLLATQRLFLVLGCQLFSWIILSFWQLSGLNALPRYCKRRIHPLWKNNAALGRTAYCITANSLHTKLSSFRYWYLVVATVLTEAFPCPDLPCHCPPLIIDIDRCSADNANLHPNRISRVI